MSEDSIASYEIGHRATREIKIREGEIIPTTIEEWRWFMAGPVSPRDLDTVRFWLTGADEKAPPVQTLNPEKGCCSE